MVQTGLLEEVEFGDDNEELRRRYRDEELRRRVAQFEAFMTMERNRGVEVSDEHRKWLKGYFVEFDEPETASLVAYLSMHRCSSREIEDYLNKLEDRQ